LISIGFPTACFVKCFRSKPFLRTIPGTRFTKCRFQISQFDSKHIAVLVLAIPAFCRQLMMS
jgi:hypothetical protein